MNFITDAITGILSAVGTLLSPAITSGSGDNSTTTAVTYVAILAAPAAVGVMTLARKMARKAR